MRSARAGCFGSDSNLVPDKGASAAYRVSRLSSNGPSDLEIRPLGMFGFVNRRQQAHTFADSVFALSNAVYDAALPITPAAPAPHCVRLTQRVITGSLQPPPSTL